VKEKDKSVKLESLLYMNKKFKCCSVEKVLVQSMFVNTDYWTTPVENNPIVE